MSTDRLAVLVRLLASNGILRRPMPAAMRDTSVTLFGTPHCGVIVMDTNGNPAAMMSSTAMMARIEELELTLGVGPCVTACQEGVPIAEPDYTKSDPARWLGFGAAALDAGARGGFAFPLVADGTIGSLNVARVDPGPLTALQHSDGIGLAHLMVQLVKMQLDGGGLETVMDELMEYQAVVHQATGMVGAQLDVPMLVGLAMLRARAFAENRPLTEVAGDVVQRRLRFDSST